MWVKYRLRQEDFERMLEAQNNKCAVCEVGFEDTPIIDHDHKCCDGQVSCGKCVRSLVCVRCNILLGHLEKQADNLTKAFKYLQTWGVGLVVMTSDFQSEEDGFDSRTPC